MKVSIEYCISWGYDMEALRVRESLERKFGLEVEMIKGSGGVFRVVDHHTNNATSLLVSKEVESRFPNRGEIESLIEGLEEVSWK